MALTAKFYTFSKRKNSTLQPSGASTDYNVSLKGGTSLLSPTLFLDIPNRPNFNYLEFEGRYYYITDIVSTRNNLWEISCVEDVLATHKTAIGNSTALIMYATGGRNNIVDTRIPLTSDVTINKNLSSITGFTIFDDRLASVIISVTGSGSFGTYLLEYAGDVKELLRNAKREAVSSITDVTTGLQQFFLGGSAANCLKAAIGLPIAFSPSQVCSSGTPNSLYLGDYECTDSQFNQIMVYSIDDPIVKGDASVQIPWVNSGWLRHSPYTQLYLYLPLIGTIKLPVDDLINDTSIEIDYSVNVTSGDISVELYGDNSSVIFATASGNCAMSTPYGSSNISGAKVTSAVITGAGGIGAALVASNPVAGTIALGASLAASATQMLTAWNGETYGGGGLGGGATQGLSHSVHLTSVSKTLTDTQANLNPIIGKPVMQKHTINSYSGFVQTDGMCVVGAMTETEYEQINKACNKGIYYE